MTTTTAAAESSTRRRGGVADTVASVMVAYRWELRKLAAQKRTWLGIAVAALTPVFFLLSIQFSKVTPGDGPYGDALGPNLRHTGLAIDPVVLVEITMIGPAILAALIAGDIVAGEDMAGTLKTILVRGLRRGQILAGKTLALFTYVLAVVLAFMIVGIPAGIIAWGFNPVTNLNGDRISALHTLGLTIASLALYTAPFLAVASFGLFLSVVTRHSVAAVVGTLFYTVALQGLSGVPAIAWIHPYLIVNQFTAWYGFFHTPTQWYLITRCLWVSALFAIPPLIAAWIIFQRRDVDS